MANNKIGYIRVTDTKINPGHDKFKFLEATFTRTINSRGDKIRSKIFNSAIEYEEIISNAEIMKDHPGLILTREPFLLDDELRNRCIKWCEWANKAEPWEYDPFAEKPKEADNV